MPPAAFDELSRQNSRFPSDNSPPDQDPFQGFQQQEAGGKPKKKGKNGSKGKDKGAKSGAKTVEEDLTQPSPPSQSEPSSCPQNTLLRPPGVSPVLEALGSLGANQDNDTVCRTGAWAKSIPFGKSPPNDLNEGGFVSGSPFSFPTAAERGGFSHASPSTSPPLGRARPLSYGNGHLSLAPSRREFGDKPNRPSVNGQFPNQPPLPHLPQAHFYGAPEIELPSPAGQNRTGMEGCYSFCAFDTTSPPFKTTKMGGRVLVIGTDGGLEVLTIEDRKTRPVGRLVGLNGRVLDAKLLPWTSQEDPYASSRPHVAVILHGPAAQKDDGAGSSSADSEPNEMLPGLTGRPLPHDKLPNKEETVYYQTRAEIYSLRTGEHITTLFASKLVPCLDNFPGLSLLAPGPVGQLKLYVSDSYVLVTSGVSGEVYVFGVIATLAPNAYQCLAKTWTTVQSRESRRYSTSSSSTDQDGSQVDAPNGSVSDSPIISLSGRWLAVVPPSSTVRTPPLGSVPSTLIQRKVYGLEAHVPPSRPSITCLTDSGEGESLFNKVARGVTQELFRGARWMGDQGLQAWNNYWNKDQQALQTTTLRRPSPLVDVQHGHIFPPTHAQDMLGVTHPEPDLVSVIDLKRLEEGPETKASLPNPVATFQTPNGCSFLSFSPNGLMLMTASKKGDIQYVWDLMQIKHCRAGAFLSDEWTQNSVYCTTSGHVRQVSRYARLTTSSIVDVIWTPPTGERLAIITRKGTVHVFDLPRSASQWPPLRRARPSPNHKPQPESLDPPEPSEGSVSTNPFAAAIKLVGGTTQPILAAVRARAPSVGPAFPAVSGFGISSTASVRGGKVVAAGLSKSVGAAATGTVNTLRHVGENRLHLTGFSRDPVSSRVAWFRYREECLLGLIDNGLLKLYRIKRSTSIQKNRRTQPVIGGMALELKLPPSLRNPCGPLQLGLFTESAIKAYWALPLSNLHISSAAKLKAQPLSQAEIETNAPYQPFHTDQRINLYVFSSDEENIARSPGNWVFGNDMAVSKLHIRPISQSDEDLSHGQYQGGGEMENLISLGGGHDQIEEVVITTRRKKKHVEPRPASASPGMKEDDGFFEDDCDVLDFARDRV